MTDGFFEGDTPHGLVKRFIWKRFIQAFVHSTQNVNLRTIIFDGFSGKGRYCDEWPTDIESYGTPLVSLRVAIEYFHPQNRQESWKFDKDKPDLPFHGLSCDDIERRFEESSTIKIYLVEKDTVTFDQLVQNAKKVMMKYGVKVASCEKRRGEHILISIDEKVRVGCHLANTSFQDATLPVLMNSEDRMVSCIDPFGYSQIPFQKIEQLMDDERKAVYITFMSSFVNRFIGVHKKQMEKLFGLPYEEFERRFKEYGDKNSSTNLTDLYEKNLKKNTAAEHSLSFEVRGKRNSLLFHLVFAGYHIKGFEAMKEAMNNGTQEADKFSLSDYNIIVKGEELNLKNGQSNEMVATKIFHKYKGRTNISLAEVKNFILYETIHVWRKEPLKMLEEDKKIEVSCSVKRLRGTFPDRLFYKIFLDFANV